MDQKEFILISGLPASGKSTLAEKISNITGYRMLSSDTIRMEYFSSNDYPQVKYSGPAKRMVFDIMYLRAELESMHRNGIILDGMHFNPQGWQRIKEIADRVGGTVFFIQLIADYHILAERIQNRGEDLHESEADITVLDRYWEKLQSGRLRYPTRVKEFTPFGFRWYEMDASSMSVLASNSDLPEWLAMIAVPKEESP